MSPLPRQEPDGAEGGVPVARTSGGAPAGQGGGIGDARAAALGERNSRLLLLAVAGYVAVISGLMIARGIGVTPDLLLVGFGLAAVVLGRGRLFFRD